MRPIVSIAALVTLTASALPANALPVNYFNPFADYGTVANSTCGPGICAAAEAINSFV